MPWRSNTAVATVELCLAALARVLVLVKLGAENNIIFYRGANGQERVTEGSVRDQIKKTQDLLDDFRNHRLVEADPKEIQRESVKLEEDLLNKAKATSGQLKLLYAKCWASILAAKREALNIWSAEDGGPAGFGPAHDKLRHEMDSLWQKCNDTVKGQDSITRMLGSDARWLRKGLSEFLELRVEWESILAACNNQRREAKRVELREALGRIRMIRTIYDEGQKDKVSLPAYFEHFRLTPSSLKAVEREVVQLLEDSHVRELFQGENFRVKWSEQLWSTVIDHLGRWDTLELMYEKCFKRVETNLFPGGTPADAGAHAQLAPATLEREADPDKLLPEPDRARLVREAELIQREWWSLSAGPPGLGSPEWRRKKVFAVLAELSNRWEEWTRERDEHLARARAARPEHAQRSLRHARAELGLVTPRKARMYQL